VNGLRTTRWAAKLPKWPTAPPHVEIVDYRKDIQDGNKTLKLIAGLLLVIVILKVVRMNKRSVQRRRDQHHVLEKVVTHIGA